MPRSVSIRYFRTHSLRTTASGHWRSLRLTPWHRCSNQMRRRCQREKGQALVEFTIAIPVFLAIVLGMLDLGRVVWANTVLADAAREGARYAIVRGGSSTSRCPVGPPASTAVVPAASSS